MTSDRSRPPKVRSTIPSSSAATSKPNLSDPVCRSEGIMTTWLHALVPSSNWTPHAISTGWSNKESLLEGGKWLTIPFGGGAGG